MSSSFSLLVHHKPGLHITFPLLQAIKHPSQHAHCCLFTHEFYVRSRVAKESIMFEHFNCNIYIYIRIFEYESEKMQCREHKRRNTTMNLTKKMRTQGPFHYPSVAFAAWSYSMLHTRSRPAGFTKRAWEWESLVISSQPRNKNWQLSHHFNLPNLTSATHTHIYICIHTHCE